MVEIKKIKVFIASPGDAIQECDMVRTVCDELNQSPMMSSVGVHLETTGWEDAVARAGDPRDIINNILAFADIIICIFHKCLGSPDRDYASNTVEEFTKAYES